MNFKIKRINLQENLPYLFQTLFLFVDNTFDYDANRINPSKGHDQR